nr:hypothetical protein [Tanacetum cinerariifolium]
MPEHLSNTKVFTMKMEILLEPTSNKLLVGPYALSWKPCQGDSLNLVNHSLVPAKSNSYYQVFNVKSLFREIDCPKKSQVKLEDYPPKEVVKQSRMSRHYPSKDKEIITGRRSKVRDLDYGEKFKTSSFGEIVSLEKSNKNVIDPTPTPHATPSQAQPSTPHASPPQEQPTTTSESSMPLLNTLLEIRTTLSQKGRINQEEVNAANKDVSAAKPTVFDDEEIAQKLHDEEVEKDAAMDKHEKDDLERAQAL